MKTAKTGKMLILFAVSAMLPACSGAGFFGNSSFTKSRDAASTNHTVDASSQSQTVTVNPPSEELSAAVNRVFSESTAVAATTDEISCPDGHYLNGVRADGSLVCKALPAIPAQEAKPLSCTTVEALTVGYECRANCPDDYQVVGCSAFELSSGSRAWKFDGNGCFAYTVGRAEDKCQARCCK